jgi:serine protease Do
MDEFDKDNITNNDFEEPIDMIEKAIEDSNKELNNFSENEDFEFYQNNYEDEELNLGREFVSEPLAPVFTTSEAPKKEAFYTETVKNENENYKKGQFKRSIAIACIVSILGGTTLGLGLGLGNTIGKNYFSKKDKKPDFSFSQPATTKDPVNTTNIKSNIYSNVIKDVEDSVVCITVSKESNNTFFSVPMETGAGSGIIFTEDDDEVYIVTNYHVISGANKVGIVIGTAEPVSAKLVGSEPESDLAVVSIKKADLEAVGIKDIVIAEFGQSSYVEVGEPVLAIGNALGEGKTATAGIISAKDKEINVQGTVLSVLQTDAAINPGNSGGALVNMEGKVIGINTAKFSESSVEGMGYSITSDVAMPIIERLKNQEERAFLGIQGEDITKDTAKMFNLPTSMGVHVTYILEGSSAEQAGILIDDIITSFDDKPILNFKGLQDIIKDCKIGDKVKIKILREGKNQITIDAVLSKNPETQF